MKPFNIALLALVIFIITKPAYSLRPDKPNLYNRFRKEKLVKVFILPAENLSKSDKPDAKGLVRELADALEKRKSINFDVVDERGNSDITIGCNITVFLWSEDDPIDLLVGTYGIAYDMLTSENYAYQEALFTVTDTKEAEVLWEEKLKIDLTQGEMTEEKSIPLINKKTVKVFIRDCFSR